MRIAVSGSSGQVGWELMRRGQAAGDDMIGSDLPELDITEETVVREWIDSVAPDILINAAAYTAVDRAETDAQKARSVNAYGPRYLAGACRDANIPLIHISTDYVFDGSATVPYTEAAPTRPMGVYGRTKLEGELAVREILDRHMIIRTAWVYGVQGQNFVKTMIRLAGERETLRVVADQIGCPTFAGDLADALLHIARVVCSHPSDTLNGTFHFCGSGSVSWHGFAEEIFRQARGRVPLQLTSCQPIPTTAYPTPAQRPAYSVLDCARIREVFGVSPRPWQIALSEMLSEWLPS
ncbi:MAG: dTDP-4-dehydrorhamnose reductase [Deltaproteobacteria bacterium]|nr:MAG: dTDP-4-dehydrorhamnose reductase [Deltaproteobacteria bacterium]